MSRANAKFIIQIDLNIDDNCLDIRYRDQGQGLNLVAIAARAREKGISFSAEDRQEIAELIFVSELSTSHNVDEISGRGVGMAAVKQTWEEIGGSMTLELDSKQERDFAHFSLRLRYDGQIDTHFVSDPQTA